MTSLYEKPFKTVPEQVKILREHGMLINDEESAVQQLRAIGYYRLSGYWYPFRREVLGPLLEPKSSNLPRSSVFEVGTEFTKVVHLYEMDRKLKLLVLDGLERVEVAMRFQLGHVLGEGHAYAHLDQTRLSSAFTGVTDPDNPLDREAWLTSEHSKWLGKVHRQEKDSKEEFVKHFKENYGSTLPAWVVTEILDFGGVSTLYGGLKQGHRDQIAEALGFETDGSGDGTTLAAWMKNLNYIRNTCAHHARLWNKNINAQGSDLKDIPDLRHASNAKNRLYASLAVISKIILHTNPEASWRNEMVQFIFANAGLANPSRMGFPTGWINENIWDPKYRPSTDPIFEGHRKIRNAFECLGMSEVAIIIAPHKKTKDAISFVRLLRDKSSLISLQIEPGTPAYIPIFQFDKDEHQVNSTVEHANQLMSAKANPWAAAKWWLSPNDALGGNTPFKVHEDKKLTTSIVDKLLKDSNGG